MTEKGAALASSALSGGWVDRQGVAPGLRLRRDVGRGLGCGSARLGINVHRELETDLWRGPWFEFPRPAPPWLPAVPLSPLTIRKIPLARRQSRAGRKMQLRRCLQPRVPSHAVDIRPVRARPPVVCLLSAPLARRSYPCRRGGEARLTQARQFLIADVRLRRRRGRHVRPSRRTPPRARTSGTGSSVRHRQPPITGRCCSQSSASSSAMTVRLPHFRARNRPSLISA